MVAVLLLVTGTLPTLALWQAARGCRVGPAPSADRPTHRQDLAHSPPHPWCTLAVNPWCTLAANRWCTIGRKPLVHFGREPLVHYRPQTDRRAGSGWAK